MMHILGKIVWIVTALASLNMGTSALFGFDMLAMLPLTLIKPAAVVIGAAGLLSLVMCVHKCMERCRECNK